MAVRTKATDYSTQWAARIAGAAPASPIRQPDDGGKLRYFSFDWTQVTLGDIASTAGLIKLPPGRWKPVGAFINTSAFGASRTLDIGWGAYTQHDGTAVVADPDGLVAAKDVSAALVAWGLGEPWPASWSSLALGSMFFQIVVITFASYLLWFWLIRHYPATRLASFTLLTPLSGLLAGMMLLGEPATPRLLAALVAVGVGIWLVNRPAQHPALPSPNPHTQSHTKKEPST